MNNLKKIHEILPDLLAQANLPDAFKLEKVKQGSNNQVFRLWTDQGSALMKIYFQHPQDKRDRLGTEFQFSQFAWNNEVQCIPQPLSCDPANCVALYSWIDGHTIAPGQITGDMLQQAISFHQGLNRHKQKKNATKLPPASEACFSMPQHLKRVQTRLLALGRIDNHSEINRLASHFIAKELSESWKSVLQTVQMEMNALGPSAAGLLPLEERCISPSDFGFHNALADQDGKLYFFDFEYAGWDDPAKLVNDFFCQVEVPVPNNLYEVFSKSIVADSRQSALHLQRMSMLFPVFVIKWCCILLNDFLPAGEARRTFAQGKANTDEEKSRQLVKAKQMLHRLSLGWPEMSPEKS